jgi:hypothetical protein
MRRFAIDVALVAVAIAGCTSSAPVSTTAPVQDTRTVVAVVATTAVAGLPVLVFSVEQTGGCGFGHLCQTWRFYSDGYVEAFRRVGPDEDPEPPRTGNVDAALVSAVSEELVGLDLGELRASLPEGVLRAAFDGVDVSYVYNVTDGQDGRFYSPETELLPTVPLFAATMEAIDAADEVIEPVGSGSTAPTESSTTTSTEGSVDVSCSNDVARLDPKGGVMGAVVVCLPNVDIRLSPATASALDGTATSLEDAFENLNNGISPEMRKLGYESLIPEGALDGFQLERTGTGELTVHLPDSIYDIAGVSTTFNATVFLDQIYGTAFTDPDVETVTIDVIGDAPPAPCEMLQGGLTCPTITRDVFFASP